MDNQGSALQQTPSDDLENTVLLTLKERVQQWSNYRYDALQQDLQGTGTAQLDDVMQKLRERGLVAFDTPLQADSQMQLTEKGQEFVDSLEGRGGDSGKRRNAL